MTNMAKSGDYFILKSTCCANMVSCKHDFVFKWTDEKKRKKTFVHLQMKIFLMKSERFLNHP